MRGDEGVANRVSWTEVGFIGGFALVVAAMIVMQAPPDLGIVAGVMGGAALALLGAIVDRFR